MNATIALDKPGEASFGAKAAREWLELWVRHCNAFRQRERQEIFEKVPSAETLAEYEADLKLMIRGARTLLNLVSDPDFPERRFIPEISGKLLQLESSWESLKNPMTDTEADAILQKVFPNDPRTGSSA